MNVAKCSCCHRRVLVLVSSASALLPEVTACMWCDGAPDKVSGIFSGLVSHVRPPA